MRRVFVLGLVVAMSGCALVDSTIDVSHDSGYVAAGPLGKVEPTGFSIVDLDDARHDKARIGVKFKAAGEDSGEILTSEPVTDIVEEAIGHALTASGHRLGDGPIEVAGAVTRFWIDMDTNFRNVIFIGDIVVELVFTDTSSNRAIYEASYEGNYREAKFAGLAKTWEDVLGRSVDALVEEIVLDEELANALAGGNTVEQKLMSSPRE